MDCVQACTANESRAGQRDFGQHCGGRILRDIKGHGRKPVKAGPCAHRACQLPAQFLTILRQGGLQ